MRFQTSNICVSLCKSSKPRACPAAFSCLVGLSGLPGMEMVVGGSVLSGQAVASQVSELPGPLTRTLNSFSRWVIQGRVTSDCPWEGSPPPPRPKVPCPAHCDRVPFTVWGWLQIKVLEDQPHGKPLWSLDISVALLALEIRFWVSGGRHLLWSLLGQEYRGLCRTSMEDSPKEQPAPVSE